MDEQGRSIQTSVPVPVPPTIELSSFEAGSSQKLLTPNMHLTTVTAQVPAASPMLSSDIHSDSPVVKQIYN